ncbi:MAG: tetratricopeptide repeat protein [Nannocystaceae bacterium]
MDRPRRRRLRAALLCLLVTLPACDAGTGPTPVAAEPAAASPAALPGAALALGYVPGEGPTERAILAAQQAVREQPEAIDRYTTLATWLLRRARETSDSSYRLYAEDALRAARARDERNPQVLLLSAMVLQDQHRFRGAAALAREYIALRPDDSTGSLVLGDALLELGEYDPAIDAYQQAMNLRPDLRSYNRAAHMRWLLGDADDAREVLVMAIDAGSERDPESRAWCFVDLGEIDLRTGAIDRAEPSARAALSLVPEYWPAQVLLARVLHRRGQVDAAIAQLDAALAHKTTAEDLLRLSDWLEQAGRREDAERRRVQAQALADAEPRAWAHWLARHDREPVRAVALAQRELAARRNLTALDTAALALLRAGRLDEAAAALADARKLGTKDAELELHTGLVAHARGDVAAARAALAAALALDPGVDPLLAGELARAVGEA